MSNITNKTIISKMKRFTLLAALGLCSISLFAQDAQKEEPKEEGFVFTTVKELPITSVKNQSRAGTCFIFTSILYPSRASKYEESSAYSWLILSISPPSAIFFSRTFILSSVSRRGAKAFFISSPMVSSELSPLFCLKKPMEALPAIFTEPSPSGVLS